MCDVDSNHISLNVNQRSLCEVHSEIIGSGHGAVVNRDFSTVSLFVGLNWAV